MKTGTELKQEQVDVSHKIDALTVAVLAAGYEPHFSGGVLQFG